MLQTRNKTRKLMQTALVISFCVLSSAVCFAQSASLQSISLQNAYQQNIYQQNGEAQGPTLGDIARKNRERRMKAAQAEISNPSPAGPSPATPRAVGTAAPLSTPLEITPVTARRPAAISTPSSISIPIPTLKVTVGTRESYKNSEIMAAAQAKVEDLRERESLLRQNLERFEREALTKVSDGDEDGRRSLTEAMEMTRSHLVSTVEKRVVAEKQMDSIKERVAAPKQPARRPTKGGPRS